MFRRSSFSPGTDEGGSSNEHDLCHMCKRLVEITLVSTDKGAECSYIFECPVLPVSVNKSSVCVCVCACYTLQQPPPLLTQSRSERDPSSRLQMAKMHHEQIS